MTTPTRQESRPTPFSGLEFDDTRSVVDQLVFHISQTIEAGTLSLGSRLPSIRAAAAQLGVNRNTVAQAYRELGEKGYVTGHYGGGSLVTRPGAAAPTASLHPVADQMAPTGAPPPELTEGDLELRFSQRMGILTGSSPKPPIAGLRDGSAINLYHLRPNTDIFPLEQFRKCLNVVLRRSGGDLLNYGYPAGYLPLREQIARRLRAGGIPADPANILITSGSQQGIDLLARAFVDPGDSVVVESPTYTNAIRIFTGHGARLLPIAIEREGIRLETLERFQFQTPPKLFYTVPNFQNPTTHTYTLGEKQALLQQVYRTGSLLAEDAYYSELHPNPGPALTALDRSGRVIYLNTFSKTLVPAVRVGYVLAPPALVRRLTELKEMTDLSHSLILQAAIAEFMERGYFDEHLVRVRAFYQERMARVMELMRRYLPPETAYSQPSGGLFLWLDLPPALDSERLAMQLQNDGVLVCPAPLFHPGGGGRNGLRLCIAFESEPRLEKAISVLGRHLRDMPPGPTRADWNAEYQGTH